MPTFGEYALLATLVAASYTTAAAVLGHHRGDPRLKTSAIYGVYVIFGLLSVASLTLVALFVTDDYSVKYVHHYSDRSMPLFYKATAFWGGQDGSLLFWVWVMSIWSAVAVRLNRYRNPDLLPYTIVAMMSVTLFFVIVMIQSANPFETYVAGAPTDGRGLNPLLQNPYMVTHPPSLYLGYIGWTVPFCFAIGALVHNRLDYAWIDAIRKWCLAAWVFLTVGLVLGGLWAYEELGWGGYWAWDPVENAAFFPWLTGTAFIHSIQVQERRQSFKMWNLFLIILTFLLTLVGTMMTRSGIVQSVHAFAQSDIGTTFGYFILVWSVASLGLLVWRHKELRPENRLESVLSREFVFLLNNWILVMMAFIVLFGTLFPAVNKWITGAEVNVGPSFFNLWMPPLGLILLFLTGVGPLLPWRRATASAMRSQFVAPTLTTLAGTALIGALGVHEPWALATFGLCVLVTATIVQEFWRTTRARMRNSGEGAADAFLNMIGRAKRRYGGYVVHFGMVLCFVAFAGNSYKIEDEQQLTQGRKARIGNYEVRFDGLEFGDDGQKTMVTATLTVFEAGGTTPLGTLHPAKYHYRKPEDQVTSEVDKRLSVRDDLYVVLGGYDVQNQVVALQLKVNPLVNFLWLGTAVMLFGWAIAVWPTRRRVAPGLSSGPGGLGLGLLGISSLSVLGVIALVAAFSGLA